MKKIQAFSRYWIFR